MLDAYSEEPPMIALQEKVISLLVTVLVQVGTRRCCKKPQMTMCSYLSSEGSLTRRHAVTELHILTEKVWLSFVSRGWM